MKTEQGSGPVPTVPDAPTSKKPLPLGALLIANLVISSLVLVAVIGFGSYPAISNLMKQGPSKQVVANAVNVNGRITALLASSTLTDTVELSNPGVAKTWTVQVPYGTTVTVTLKTASDYEGIGQGTCNLFVDGVRVAVQSATESTTGLVVCTWLNDGKS